MPILNLRPKNNGLLTTIEQAAMSDEEPGSPTEIKGFESPSIHNFQGSSRIPTPKSSNSSSTNQPNYENVAGGRLTESPIGSMIPVAKKTSLPTMDRLSTANFVANNPSPRKHSADMISSSNRTLATPSPRPMLSKIPVPGSLQK